MSKSLVFLSALAATAMAEPPSSIMDVFLPGFDSQTLVASVMTANPTMAQYYVTCGGGDDEECGAGPGVTVTMQPGTYAMVLDEGDAFTMSERCVIEHQTAVCTVSMGGSEANDPGVETGTISDDEFTSEDFFMHVTVTAGLDKLAAATATGTAAAGGASTANASPAQSGGSSMPTATGTATGASASGSAETDSSSVSTGGAPYATQNAMMAGIVAFAGALLL